MTRNNFIPQLKNQKVEDRNQKNVYNNHDKVILLAYFN